MQAVVTNQIGDLNVSRAIKMYKTNLREVKYIVSTTTVATSSIWKCEVITTLLNEKQLEHIQHFTIFRYTTAKTTGAYTFDKIFWMSVMPVDDSLIIFCITF